MGKCIFTGNETSSTFNINSEKYYVCDAIQKLIYQAKYSDDYNNRIKAFKTIMDFKNTFDKDHKDVIDSFCSELQVFIYPNDNIKAVSGNKNSVDSNQKLDVLENKDIPINNSMYTQFADIMKLIIKVLLVLSIIGDFIGMIYAFVVDIIALGLVLLFAGPIVIVITYFFEMFILEIAENIAGKRAAQDLTNEYLKKLLENK